MSKIKDCRDTMSRLAPYPGHPMHLLAESGACPLSAQQTITSMLTLWSRTPGIARATQAACKSAAQTIQQFAGEYQGQCVMPWHVSRGLKCKD